MSGRRSIPLNLIVASTHPGLGIGKNGSLPWPMLKGEMGFFSRVTKRVDTKDDHSSSKPVNAIIMGRKTWDSIPEKLRPLKERLNIVVSSTMPQPSLESRERIEGPYVRPSLSAALNMLRDIESTHEVSDAALSLANIRISRVFVIGGSSLYKEAVASNSCERVLLTKIYHQYDCDVFFPIDLDSGTGEAESWGRRSAAEWADWTGEIENGSPKETRREEKDISYEFCLYERA